MVWRRLAALSCPVPMLPVSETIATFGWLISALPVVAPRPVDDVDDAFGKDLGDGLGKLQRRQRRLLRRLDDDGVAASQRGRELPGRHHQRIVPRRDRADDADRIAADHRGVARHIFAGHGAMHVAHGAGKEAEAVDDRRHLVLQHADARLAAVQRFERGEGFGIALDGVGELQQERRALGRRGARPGLERLLGRIHRRVDLRGRGIGELDDGLLGLGVDHGFRRFGAVDEFRADQHLRVEHEFSSAAAWFAGYFVEPPVCSPSRVR